VKLWFILHDKASKKEIHSKTQTQNLIPLGTSPNYKFEFGDVQLFQKQVRRHY
jgi:cell division protease FtsH